MYTDTIKGWALTGNTALTTAYGMAAPDFNPVDVTVMASAKTVLSVLDSNG